ncbi:DNA-directed DNA polymerase, family A, palm domain containing protein [uncultured Caudovirales phage]|uniref:DNA-directed DNA polymerase, family A, palm domain containing protein n=1 Tax=uncultured Caudovirales phage TaxID=2100421 RepID=A0A6J5KQN7_9CAUD|nr:DNA-directed DNA polymerase, family A, palm domain containing protein [uncultured Caudovirales phage]
MRLHIDFETRSTIDLRKTGVYVYADHPTTDVILACWAVDDHAVESWYHRDPNPSSLMQLLADPSVTVVAHNAGFERAMLQSVLGPRYGWPVVPLDRWDCTAARAARQALPRDLGGAAIALGLSVEKDTKGKALMRQMCRPRSLAEDGTVTWWEDAPRMQRLTEYCITDVEVERQLDKVLRHLTPKERNIWRLTECMNDRGVLVDIAFANLAIEFSKVAQRVLDEKMARITGGVVRSCTNVPAMKGWLSQRGYYIPEDMGEGLNRKTVENILAAETAPEDVREALLLRQQGGKSSVKKYQAMRDRASSDGRVRGNLLYSGASTGRWSGAGVQIQNLPRETPKDWDATRANLRKSNEPLSDLSKMLRGSIIAAPGHRLMWADFASIEARGVAWLAKQEDLTARFAEGADVYCDMASEIYGREVTKADAAARQIGKATVLGCGYSMGPLRFRQACAAMGQDITEELAKRAVVAYRTKYPCIPELWRALNAASLGAVRHKYKTTYAPISFEWKEGWLELCLPSLRKLFYREPQIGSDNTDFGTRDVLQYMAQNQITRKWTLEKTFGGKLVENVVQAICRDLIADAMLNLEAAGYPVIASVHDEVICEVPNGQGSIEEMIEIMCRVPEWAAGFPIAAEGKEATRYGK